MHHLNRKLCKPVIGQEFSVRGVTYTIQGPLGDGAAGLVRKVRRIPDGSDFAIKFLAPDAKYIDEAVFDDVAARFRREGQRAPRLVHENLVTIHAYEENLEGQAFGDRGLRNPFILMEQVKGSTLEDFIKREGRRRKEKGLRNAFELTQERLSIAAHVGQALQYLHQRKLLHRDVKPANIFLPDTGSIDSQPRAKLGVFGIMKWGDFQASVSSGTLTVTSQKGLGTLKYMSPEQALAPKEVTVRSDIFSFGITLFELFTGQTLPSPHHVFEVQNARLSRGTTTSRMMALGFQLADQDTKIAELVLDMHLRGVSGRPPIDKIVGRLIWEWERRTDEEW